MPDPQELPFAFGRAYDNGNIDFSCGWEGTPAAGVDGGAILASVRSYRFPFWVSGQASEQPRGRMHWMNWLCRPSAANRSASGNKPLGRSPSRWQLVDELGPFALDHDAHFIRDDGDRLYIGEIVMLSPQVVARHGLAIDGVALDRLLHWPQSFSAPASRPGRRFP